MSLPAIVVVHNRYRDAGGEDAVFEQESALLEAHGHRVERIEATYDEAVELSRRRLAVSLFWNRDAARRVSEAVARTGATIVHFHNTVPLISPAAYYAARSAGAAVVQTLHNYRLVCPGGLLLRDGAPCEVCVGSPLAWRGVAHGCYRDSRVESAGMATMVAAHRMLGTWRRQVDAYIALGAFPRDRFVEGGLPADRIHVRPNFLATDPGVGDHRGDYALFVGRLTEQKGVRVMVDAWREMGGDIPLRIIGGGELDERALGRTPGVEWLGPRGPADVMEAMRGARALVFPSISYENCPMTVVEAFATGLPVLASRTGSLPGMVAHEGTGLLFEPRSSRALGRAVRRAWREPEWCSAMGRAARAAYESAYTASIAYADLMAIYDRARRRFLDTENG